MLFRLAIFVAILVASVYGACPTVPAGGCNICGAGKCVSKASAIVRFGTYPQSTCAKLQTAGFAGKTALINNNCTILATVVKDLCGCNSVGIVSEPTAATPEPPTATSPEPTTACPATPAGGCSVCGEGKCVSEASAIVSFGTYPKATCARFEAAGLAGKTALINQNCAILATVVKDLCGCNSVGIVSGPTATTPEPPTATTPEPTTAKPTPTPTSRIPTTKPSRKPTRRIPTKPARKPTRRIPTKPSRKYSRRVS